MTIQEQILAGLQTKFPGADTATLTRIASKKAEGVTDQAQADSIVEGVGLQDVIQNYGDFRAGQATTSAVQNYEKKHGLKDGKPIGEQPQPTPQPQPQPEGAQPDIAKLIADGIAAGIKPLSDRLAAYEQREAQAQRAEQIATVAGKYGIPEFVLKDRSIPEGTDLEAYFKDVRQEMQNAGFQGSQAPETAQQQLERETSAFAKMIDDDTKQIVEQQNNK